MPQDSLKKRYIYKLLTNFIGLAIGLVTFGMVPRGLGPKLFGDFGYLTDFFTKFIGFFDMGTSTCFYTKLSQRQDDDGLVKFYMSFIMIVSFITLFFILVAWFFCYDTYIWKDQVIFFVFLAAIWGILDWIFRILYQMMDAYGLTILAERIKVIQKVIGMVLILILFYSNRLFLVNYFLYWYIILLFIIIAFIVIMKRQGYYFKNKLKLKNDQIKSYTKEFWSYSSPLFMLAIVSIFVGLLDRWLLQSFGGSSQQGYFNLAQQIAAICFMFTSAMTPLLHRELSISFANKNFDQMACLFRRYIPMLYSIVAYFACFFALQADKVAVIFGGSNFKEASLAVVIMSFYPLHQTYGQLSGSVFFATGQTKLYKNISIVFNLIGILFLVVLLAPANYLGLNLGAVGLAIKTVIVNIFSVNVGLYYNTKFLKLTFWKYLFHQFYSLVVFLGISYLNIYLVDHYFNLKQQVLISFLLSGFIYTVCVIFTAYFQPMVFGFSKDEIRSIINQGKNKIQQTLNKKII